MREQLLDSWDIHNRMLFMLFDAIEPEGFQGRPTGMTGRSVGNIFAHLHNIRRGWVEVAAPALLDGVEKIPTRKKADKEALTKALLRPALERSAQAVRDMVEQSFEAGKLKGMKPHLIGSFSYFIAHEWYHIGEICMTLTESGHRLDDQILYGIWSWGRWNPGQKPPEGDES
jgi:uncharacterized damage-inducible protein DinB